MSTKADRAAEAELPKHPSAPPPKPPLLPPTHILQKRPLLHPPIPPIHSKRSPQTVYISARTPFISAVKRVRKILSLQESSLWPSTSTLGGASNEQHRRQRKYRNKQRRRGSQRGSGGNVGVNALPTLTQTVERGEPVGEGVVLKATGKAINKCLSLGVYFMKDDTVAVRVGTGSVDAVDDIVRKPGAAGMAKAAPPTQESTSQQDNSTVSSITTSLDLPTQSPGPTSTRKRKSADSEESEASEQETQGEKKPKTEEPTPAVPSSTNEEFTDSNPPTIPQNLPLPCSSDVLMTDPPTTQSAASEDNEDDESEEDDDDDNEDYMRIRKLSMIEIKINLVRP